MVRTTLELCKLYSSGGFQTLMVSAYILAHEVKSARMCSSHGFLCVGQFGESASRLGITILEPIQSLKRLASALCGMIEAVEMEANLRSVL
jgi:hypothetical protein